MNVEKIEMNGFKSFGDKMVVELHPGVTCIVGPNGCGKSNVVDAFKWVLGEQSVKSLRGGKMEDVIFTGSMNKKPKGMAEVSLYIKGLNPAEGPDSITIVTRRLYRSGDSDYMLNRQSCRLKDIRDIFLDTGLEVKSYSILEQDRVSSILSAKPEDRRFLIEEVAGVVKYKVRRHEAKNKLESSRANLARINDIVGEIRRQLNSLDRQARKAERYKQLMEELKEIELKSAGRDYEELAQELERTLEAYSVIRQENASLRAAMSKEDATIEAMRIELAETEKAQEEKGRALGGVQRQMAELEREKAIAQTDREHLSQNIIKLGVQKEENANKRAASLARKAEIEESLKGLSVELAELQQQAEAKERELKDAEAGIKGREHHLDTKRRDSFKGSEALGNVRSELHKHQAALDNLSQKHAELTAEARELERRLSENENSAREIQGSIIDRNNQLMVFREESGMLDGEIVAIKSKIEALNAETARNREEMASASSRLESLREMDFSESTEEQLKGDIEILGAVSDVIQASADHERAIEAALRECINGFVLKDASAVPGALDVLHARATEKTAFITKTSAEQELPALPEGALGRASEMVRVKQGFEHIAAALLGAVAVMRDAESALAASGRTRMAMVTLKGEIFLPGGAVVAGKSRGILALKRQIRELTDEIARRRMKLDTLKREGEALAAQLAEKDAAFKKLQQRAVDAEKELSLLKLRAEGVREEAERLNRKQAQNKIDTGNVAREQEAIKLVIANKQAEIGRLETDKGSIEDAIKRMQDEIASMRESYEAVRSVSVELKIRANSAAERMGSLRKESEGLDALARELDEKDVLIERDREATEQRIAALIEQSADKERQIAALAVSASQIEAAMNEVRAKIAERGEQLREMERELRGTRLRIDEITQRMSELEVRKTELVINLENLVANIRRNYDVELSMYEPSPITEEEEQRLPEIKDKISKLGPVSLGSIEEYNELKERHDFLSKQQEDLNKSIAELEEAIARINATTRKKLREAFVALRDKFAEVFVSLFGGGKAELVLTDESNILETGLDITAQPPGKRLQNISLLSGGEKTLTALALLFAGFLIKPTPLCILDEADAALDENNTQKFSELIKSLSQDIQFIVVTHNRVTMETADFIYGVTMEEPGNSKLISMELTQA